jgi:tetratricopeptide (TPR) repeat protein
LGRDTTLLREILDKTSERLDTLTNEPAVDADLRATLGNVYLAVGEHERSETMFRRALELRQALWREDHPLVAQSLADVSRALRARGKSSEAEALAYKALEMRVRLFGPKHPDVAASLSEVAHALSAKKGTLTYSQGAARRAEAGNLYRRALAMRRELLGNENLETAQSVAQLGAWYAMQGANGAAEARRREALEIQRKLLGESHPQVALSLGAVGATLSDRGKYAEAEPFIRQSLDVRRRLLGPKHPGVGQSTKSLSEVLLRLLRFKEAEAAARDALSIQREALGNRHPDTVRCIDHLVFVLVQSQGDLDEAERLLRESMAAWEELKDKSKSDFSRAMLIVVLQRRGRHEEAQRLVDAYDGNRLFHYLGWINRDGLAGVSDLTEAAKWRLVGAEKGHRIAQFSIGLHYLHGRGVEKDPVSAVRWLRKSAEQRYAPAYHLLGHLYAAGIGTPEDEAEAARWFRKEVEELRKAANTRDFAAANELAWRLATCELAAVRDAHAALEIAETAVAATDRQEAAYLDTLAAAHAEIGRFDQAVKTQEEAVALVQGGPLRDQLMSRLQLYRVRKAYHHTLADEPTPPPARGELLPLEK